MFSMRLAVFVDVVVQAWGMVQVGARSRNLISLVGWSCRDFFS